MSTLDTQTTVGQMVAERPSRARVFERLGIDYCCGGKVPLEQVCQEKGLDVTLVLQSLRDQDQGAAESDSVDWTKMSLTTLADQIVATHHANLRRELPRLEQLVNRVATVHGPHYPELLDVKTTFYGLKAELEEHMLKEEEAVFPMIKGLESGSNSPPGYSASVRYPIAAMIHEHDSTGAALSRLRSLTSDYVPPSDACNTYRAMLDGLAELESDMHLHIHKENNILFPRAIQAEAASPETGHGLDGLLRTLGKRLSGVLNGIDDHV
ncbi:MAG: iron-sulfur cluster repair di-iron protein, partial [Isosphaeraceae bacterium]